MDKKTILAFLFIALILMAMPYYYEMIGLAPPPPQEEAASPNNTPPEKSAFSTPKAFGEGVVTASPGRPIQTAFEETIVYVKTPLYVAGVSSRGGGSLVSFVLKNYPLNDSSLVNLVMDEINRDNLLIKFKDFTGENVILDYAWILSDPYAQNDTVFAMDESRSLEFSSTIDGNIINKALTFNPDSYTIGLTMDLQSVGRDMMSQERFTLVWNGGLPSTEPNKSDEASFYAANHSQGQEVTKHNG